VTLRGSLRYRQSRGGSAAPVRERAAQSPTIQWRFPGGEPGLARGLGISMAAVKALIQVW